MHMRVVEFRLPPKYEIHGGTPANFVVLNFGATAFFPVLCRISDTPKGIKYRAERPPFFFSFGVRPSSHTLPKFHQNSCVFRPIFGVFGGGGSPPGPLFEVKDPLRDHFLRSKRNRNSSNLARLVQRCRRGAVSKRKP